VALDHVCKSMQYFANVVSNFLSRYLTRAACNVLIITFFFISTTHISCDGLQVQESCHEETQPRAFSSVLLSMGESAACAFWVRITMKLCLRLWLCFLLPHVALNENTVVLLLNVS
jgi:hypothetical protein